MPGEFEIITSYFAPSAKAAPTVALGVGDDCALVMPPSGEQLAISIDTLVEGVHFLPDISAEDLAWRLLGSSVSDLAAMGAEPLWLTLSVTLPRADESWLAAFRTGLDGALERYQITLVGGDTCSGPVRVLTAQVQGSVPAEKALRRSGAQPGDIIFASGTLGDSRAGLELIKRGAAQSEIHNYLLQRFLRPTPRTELGLALRDIATAAIDISDGLLADLGHLLDRSSVGAEVELETLPLSQALSTFVDQTQARQWASTGGEDFELCFTVAEEHLAEVDKLSARLDLPLTPIGRIVSGSGVHVSFNGESWVPQIGAGFDHFGDPQ
ncbi:MAG TPA: thiamine-phosphate kinase [Marinobacterium sp.]|nr:thiamine-phosphate kinase [Marinobacterium sp.]